jgi:hypothetical protein
MPTIVEPGHPRDVLKGNGDADLEAKVCNRNKLRPELVGKCSIGTVALDEASASLENPSSACTPRRSEAQRLRRKIAVSNEPFCRSRSAANFCTKS